jgi:rSAM/selenodomain-associated transferase 2
MGGEPGVTVVIPSLNEEGTIGACLASVGEDSAVRVVVSDGGSTDRTLTLLDGAADVLVVRGSKGRGQQLNRGAAATDTTLLLFLHADCRLPPRWLPALRWALADLQASLACYRLHTEPSTGGSRGRVRRAWLRMLDLRSRGLWLPYGDQGFGLRRSDFDELGGFPEIPLMEDLAMARACRRRGRIRRIPLEVYTTARRFDRHPVRTRFMTVVFPVLFRLGVSPWRLARWYGEVR